MIELGHMADTYSLNPDPVPQAPMTREEHHRLLNLLMIVVTVAIIIGVLYWWTASVTNQPQPVTVSSPMDQRAQVAAMLWNSPVHATQQEIDNVAAQLANSEVTATEAERQAIANQLGQGQ
jgi:hypothetical protein